MDPAQEPQPTQAGALGDVAPELSEQSDPAAPFEVTLLVPSQSFLSSGPSDATSKKTPAPFLELPCPITVQESVQELCQLIVESPEGFWLGTFGLLPVTSTVVKGTEASEEPTYGPWVAMLPPAPKEDAPLDPSIWRLKNGVLGEFADLRAVFGGSEWDGVRRGLQVVNTSYAPLPLSVHLLRVRDKIASSGAKGSMHDPSSVALGAGTTLYPTVRGVVEAPSVEDAEPVPEQPNAFTDWTVASINPFASLAALQATLAPTTVTCVRSFGVSAWSPPPHPLRVRGHIVYLVVSTLEGETYHITGATSGFWVSKSGNAHFDPAPRTPTLKGLRSTPYHSLFELLAALSPAFATGIVASLELQNPSTAAIDIYASLPVTHSAPATSWIVPAPVHTSDPLRTQLAYLITTTTDAELLHPARDWNDELTQFKELPTTTPQEKLFRERLLSRVQSEFVSAATKAALSISRGDVPPLNPNEHDEAHTYVSSNMLFTRADDAIGSFSHLGGNEAARVAASKDLRGVGMLERLDIADLHTMATVIVDFCGQRWVVQSLVPGLFKTKEPVEESDLPEDASAEEVTARAEDKPFPSAATANLDDYPPQASFRIVYGSADPENPDAKVRTSKYFGTLAQQAAEGLKLAKHSVQDAEGRSVQLWTSADMHGIAGPDGRSYLLDCFRAHCVDVEFLENETAGPIRSDSSLTANGVHPVPYPHRLVLLRPELIQSYHESKLQKWIEDKVYATRDRIAAETAAKEAADALLQPGTEVAVAGAVDGQVVPPPQSIINASDFKLSFNPDAFVERKPVSADAAPVVIYDAEEQSTKEVRNASVYLRDVILPLFIVELVASSSGRVDGFFLSKLMHRKGINMRYLGVIAHLVEHSGLKLEHGKNVSAADIAFELEGLKASLVHEMITRASKHILNRALRTAQSADRPAVVSHFLNCLLGSAVEPEPVAFLDTLPAGASTDRTWAALTPASVQTLVIAEVEKRYRYALTSTSFESIRPIRLLRELSMRVGIQLLLREYHFVPSGSIVLADKVVPTTPVSAPKKKKASGKKAKAEAASAELQLLSFRPEDVLNIIPVVKNNTHRSQLTDEVYEAGRRALSEGNVDVGQDAVSNALAMYEQIYGPVHAIASAKSHSLGIVYHQLYQTIMRKVTTHDVATQVLSEMGPKEREENAVQFAEAMLEDVAAARHEAESYLQSSVRSIRQSLIVTERTLGLDASETCQQYTDLTVLEHGVGNSLLALRLSRHAIDLWASTYGPDHPAILKIMTTACSIMQSIPGSSAGTIPLLLECYAFAIKLHGKTSMQTANAAYALAQTTGLGGDFAASHPYAIEASNIYSALLGAESAEAVEAGKFEHAVGSALLRREQESKASEERAKAIEKALKAKAVGAPSVGRKAVPAKAARDSIEQLADYINGVPPAKGKGKKKAAQEKKTVA